MLQPQKYSIAAEGELRLPLKEWEQKLQTAKAAKTVEGKRGGEWGAEGEMAWSTKNTECNVHQRMEAVEVLQAPATGGVLKDSLRTWF